MGNRKLKLSHLMRISILINLAQSYDIFVTAMLRLGESNYLCRNCDKDLMPN